MRWRRCLAFDELAALPGDFRSGDLRREAMAGESSCAFSEVTDTVSVVISRVSDVATVTAGGVSTFSLQAKLQVADV